MAVVTEITDVANSSKDWRLQYNRLLENIGYTGRDDVQAHFTVNSPQAFKLVMTGANGLISPNLVGDTFGLQDDYGFSEDEYIVRYGAATLQSHPDSVVITSNTVVDSTPLELARSVNYVLNTKRGFGEWQQSEISIIHDGSTASFNNYNIVYTGAQPIATFTADIGSGSIRLLGNRSFTDLETKVLWAKRYIRNHP